MRRGQQHELLYREEEILLLLVLLLEAVDRLFKRVGTKGVVVDDEAKSLLFSSLPLAVGKAVPDGVRSSSGLSASGW